MIRGCSIHSEEDSEDSQTLKLDSLGSNSIPVKRGLIVHQMSFGRIK